METTSLVETLPITLPNLNTVFWIFIACISLFIIKRWVYKTFIRLFWAEKTLAILEYFIDKSFNLILMTKIEAAALLGDQIDKEMPIMRKSFVNTLYTLMGPNFTKQCLYLFGSEDGFVTYVTIRYEELFKEHGTEVMMSAPQPHPDMTNKVEMKLPEGYELPKDLR